MDGSIRTVRLYRPDGSPLLAIIQPFEQEPYRRTLVGFLPDMQRNAAHEYMDWCRDERPPISSHAEDAEGIELEVEGEEEEEGCTCRQTSN